MYMYSSLIIPQYFKGYIIEKEYDNFLSKKGQLTWHYVKLTKEKKVSL